MKAALASKIALCVCPPVLVATTVATVPPVRRTVHRLTASHHPHAAPHHRRRHALAAAPCAPGAGGPGSLRTFASPGPTDEPTGPLVSPGSGPLSYGVPSLGDLPGSGDYRTPYTPAASTPGGFVTPAVAPGGGGIVTPTPTPTSTPTDGTTPAVPEPLTWTMLLAGVGAVGAALRRRGGEPESRRRTLARIARANTAADLLAASAAPLGATGQAVGQAAGSQAVAGGVATGAKSTKAALLAKAALCVCPPALLATGVATVPPVRHAVHSATAPHGLRPAAAGLPCAPVVAIVDPRAPAADRQELVSAETGKVIAPADLRAQAAAASAADATTSDAPAPPAAAVVNIPPLPAAPPPAPVTTG